MVNEVNMGICPVYEGDQPYLFISYSHEDSERVVGLIRKLQGLGVRVWYDYGIPSGSGWAKVIAEHIETCKCFASMLSRDCAVSEHCIEEFNYAHTLKKDILPVFLEECALSSDVAMRVASLQCIKCEHYGNEDELIRIMAVAKILADCFEEKDGGSSAEDRIAQLREKAEAGDPAAQTDLGMVLIRGDDEEKNCEEAVKWYRKAAEQGYGLAQNNLGWCYYHGKGVEPSYEEAVKWYRMAADRGHAGAQWILGMCYYRGEGVSQNCEEAVEWYRKAAEQGHELAQTNLACCYEQGEGVEKSYQEAAKWYRKAAEQGCAQAQQRLARYYRTGRGVRINWKMAKYWEERYQKNPNK